MNWHQFVIEPDPVAEENLKIVLRKLNSANKEFFMLIASCLKLGFPSKFSLVLHAFYKIQLAIESCILLLQNGYYGTANAMYRQIYEFILWARISFVLDESKLKDISDAFFSSRYSEDDPLHTKKSARKPSVIPYIKKHITWSIPSEFSKSITQSEMEILIQNFYADLCALTHASNESQQYFIAEKTFYDNLTNSTIILTTLLYAAFDIFDMLLGIELDYHAATPSVFSLYSIEDSTKKHLQELDSLLEALSPTKCGNTPFLIVSLRGKWEVKPS